MTTLVHEEDARCMVRLVADVAGMNGDLRQAKKHLMEGLKSLVRADCWVWMLAYLHPDKPPSYASLQHGGFTKERFSRYLQAIEHPNMRELTAPFAQELVEAGIGNLVTRLRQQIDNQRLFPTTNVYPLWLAADIAPLMLSAKPLSAECVSLIGLYRRADDELFDERERQVAQILLEEVSWLHAAGWPEDFGAKVPPLPRRLRVVLNLLLEGHSRKYIASELGLSVHTVSDYVKELYRSFNVQSHAELMRRFMGK